MTKLACVLVAVVTTSASVGGRQTTPRPSASQLVTIDVALSRSPSRALARSDFQVFADGQPAQIADVTASPLPVRTIVLLDSSQSMGLTANLFDAVTSRLANVVKADDDVRLASFGAKILIGPAVTGGAPAWSRATRRLYQPEGPSPLWDALDQSISALASGAGRRVVIVFTDAEASGNDKSSSEVHARLVDEGVSLYALAVPDAQRTNVAAIGRNTRLELMAEDTGGRFIEISDYRGRLSSKDASVPEVKNWLPTIIEGLRGQYRLAFVSPFRDGAVHSIEVRVNVPGVDVRTRRSYRSSKTGL